MPLNTGTMNLADLQAVTNQTVRDFGFDAFADVLTNDLNTYNGIVAEAFRDFCEITVDPLRRVGGTQAGDMIEADDYSRAPTQKPGIGGTLGFPMHLHQTAIGWTQRFINRASVGELATVQLNIQGAHRRALLRRFKQAIYAPSNLTFSDYTQRNAIDIPVKRFYNADSWSIPSGPNGEAFVGSTHTHYTAETSLSAAALLAHVNLVAEHVVDGGLQLCINAANETAVRALSGFIPYVDNRLLNPIGVANTPRQQANAGNTGNRPIGLFGAAEVWVKPWAIASYAVTLAAGAAEKPLALRTENGAAPALVRVAENDAFPLIAQFYESLFGFGALGRGLGAVHYFGGASYVEPTIS
jgi:hypothetical protein